MRQVFLSPDPKLGEVKWLAQVHSSQESEFKQDKALASIGF